MTHHDTVLELLALSLLPGVGPRRVAELRTRGPLAHVLRDPGRAADLLPEAALSPIRSGEALRRARSEADRAARLGLVLTGLDDAEYPALLGHAFDPPSLLYVQGTLKGLEDRRSVAIVGSRGASPAGVALARRMARELASAGLAIVSGLARGIDTAAHMGALDAGGVTIAIQGRGMDGVYPPENSGLARRIAESGGAIASECPLGAGPAAENFPRRNRIIASLAEATIVVEAGKRSGALITARFALEEGREVLAVPGHPTDERSFGPNGLIRDGAVLVRDASDVASELGLEFATRATDRPAEGSLLALFEPDVPLSLEALCEKSGEPLPALLAALAALEIDARVRRLPGPLFVKA